MIATVLRHQRHSNGSGAVLARALGIQSAGPEHQRRTSGDRYIVNWGVTQNPAWRQREAQYSNLQQHISIAVDKLRCLQTLRHNQVNCLIFTQNSHEAIGWFEQDGKVIARDVLNGHSGQGIRVIRSREDEGNSPLYTRYFKKDHEYRVHVAFGRVILIQQKKRGDHFAGDDRDRSLIRTNGNGWVFCINDLDCDAKNYRPVISDLALRAAQAVGINHGAVDILVKLPRAAARTGGGEPNAVVCEINTAPALRNPSTLGAWVEAFRTKFNELGIQPAPARRVRARRERA